MPLFSKVCESFLLDRINSEVKVDLQQYGGVRKCGGEHMLLQSWDNKLRGLEDNRGSVDLMSLDFSKAFNRMSHQACLQAFHKKGVSNQTLNLIAAFLSNRRMTVRIGNCFSNKLPINGRSPQGCVTANALFCATVQFLQDGQLEEEPHRMECGFAPSYREDSSVYAGATIVEDAADSVVPFEENGLESVPFEELTPRFLLDPISPPQNFRPRTSSSPINTGWVNYSSHVADNSSLQFTLSESPAQRHQAGFFLKNRMHDTATEDDNTEYSCVEEIAGLPVGWTDSELWKLKYIDDGLSGETVCNMMAACHITEKKKEKFIRTIKSERLFKLTTRNAEDIGMKINAKKTKMLFVTVAKKPIVNTYINLPSGERQYGCDELKMLGFVFGRRPTATAHVTHIKKKFYCKLWIIRHMQKANTSKTDLVAIYKTYILPVIEYCSAVYHHLLTVELDIELEKLQSVALKLIFGIKTSYALAMKTAGITALRQRRYQARKTTVRSLETDLRRKTLLCVSDENSRNNDFETTTI